MANGFRFTGPACCCCHHLYTNDQTQVRVYRHVVKDGVNEQFGANYYEKTEQWSKLDFDPVHKKVFVSLRGVVGDNPRQRIAKLSEDFTNELTLASHSDVSEQVMNMTSDSDNARVFYIVRDVPFTTDRYLYVVNHDATGGAFVGPLTNNQSTEVQHAIQYCRPNAKIYYCAFDATPVKTLYSIDPDGTNDTAIAAPTHANGDIEDVTVDNVAEKIFWIEIISGNGNESKIWKADLDGTNIELIYTAPANATGTTNISLQGLQWSHKLQRLYWWEYNVLEAYMSDTLNGWKSSLADGTDVQLVATRAQEWEFDIPNIMRLGCVWEETGAGSPA